MVQYEDLTEFKKEQKTSNRWGSIYKLYLNKLFTILIKDKRTWLFNALLLLPLLAGPIIALATPSALDPEEYFSIFSDVMFMGYIGLVIPLFTMYIGTMLFSDEISNRTITFITVRPVNRLELVFVKYLSYLTLVPLFAAIGSLGMYGSFAIFGGFKYFNSALWYMFACVISSIVYGAVFMFVGLAFKRPLWFGLFFIFVWEFVIATFSTTLTKLSIAYYIKSLLVKNPFSGEDSPVIFPGNQAWQFDFYNRGGASVLSLVLVLALIVIIAISLSWAKLQGDRFIVPYQAGRRPGGWKYYIKEIRSYLITFAIIFLAIGVIIGPTTGLEQESTDIKNYNVNISPYVFYDDIEEVTLESMGYASYTSYDFSAGDTLEMDLTISSMNVNYEEMTSWVLLTSKNNFTGFVNETKELWFNYSQKIEWGNESKQFPDLIANYSTMSTNYVNRLDNKKMLEETYTSVTFTTPSRGEYYLVVITTNIDTTETNFFNLRVQGIIDKTLKRIPGYIFGWVLIGFGVITGGLGIYSLITYSSADEIERYEEQVRKFDRKQEEEQMPYQKIEET
jgi:ABC-type transport system involved in multi-copper enzyme maturation permease subunit